MKNAVLNKCMMIIQNEKNYDEVKLAELRYKFEALYLTFTKLFVLTLLSVILGLFKEYLLFTLFYIPLRTFSFGMHAKKSWHCWIISTLAFIGIPYLIKIVILPIYIKVILAVVCSVLYLIFAPADTEKRPIINKKRRLFFKITTVLISIIYIFLIIYVPKISNILLFSLLYQAFLVNPVTYLLFKQKYNNYQSYCLD